MKEIDEKETVRNKMLQEAALLSGLLVGRGNVEKVGIVGSLTRDKENPSDIDLAIFIDDKSAIDFQKERIALKKQGLGKKVNFGNYLTLNDEDWNLFARRCKGGPYLVDTIIISAEPSEEYIKMMVKEMLSPTFLEDIGDTVCLYNPQMNVFERKEVFNEQQKKIIERMSLEQIMKKNILYNEQGLKPGTVYEKGQWKKIASHNEKEIKGFFGEYRFLSNFGPARVFLDGEEYSSVENAYQAAKYEEEFRDYFKKCSPLDAKKFARDNREYKYTKEEWDNIKLQIMRGLLIQKFDKTLNPENYKKLMETGDKYLEETNYWGDIYWGVNKSEASEEGRGENNLGKLLMEIRRDQKINS